MIPVYKPYLPPESLVHARRALETGWVSSLGEYTERAERVLAERLGVRHAILVANGTVAGHLAARCVRRLRPAVRRFVVPNNVFIAAWNSLLYEYPVDSLHPVDACERTWNADLSSLQRRAGELGPETCFLVVHNLGNTVHVPRLRAAFPRCEFIEDACESVFGCYGGQPAGSAAWISWVSFFSNKNISCGEGGAVLTNDDEAAALMRLWKGQGQGAVRYLHTDLGYNYRMTNVQAGLLLGQLDLWDSIRAMKRRVFAAYTQRLAGVGQVALQACEAQTEPSQWMFGIRVPGLADPAAATAVFREAGIETRPMFFPIDHHGHLRTLAGNHRVAEALHRECIILPSWPELSESQIDQVCAATERVASRALQSV